MTTMLASGDQFPDITLNGADGSQIQLPSDLITHYPSCFFTAATGDPIAAGC